MKKAAASSSIMALWPFAGITMVFTVIGCLGIHNWIPDMATQFFLQYLVVQFLFCAFLFYCKEYKQALAVLPFMAVCLFKIVPFYLPDSPVKGVAKAKISVLQANVLYTNNQYDKVIEYVKEKDAEIVLFEEVTPDWLQALTAKMPETYRPVQALSRKDNFGIALFTKLNVIESKVINLGYVKTPCIACVFEKNGEDFGVLNAHTVPPISNRFFRERNLQYDEIALYGEKLSERLLVVGDLNTTAWSPYFTKLLEKTKLKDSSKGFGLQATWPALFCPLGLTLDQCLYSEHFRLVKREVGTNIGSDHLPLYVELEIVK